jgi:hypothetical protein
VRWDYICLVCAVANHHRTVQPRGVKQSSGSSVQRWRLQPEWKKWVNENPDGGGVIGALAERSRRLWKEREGLLGGKEIEKMKNKGKTLTLARNG